LVRLPVQPADVAQRQARMKAPAESSSVSAACELQQQGRSFRAPWLQPVARSVLALAQRSAPGHGLPALAR
jgi:hypothetical protein